MLTQNPQNKIVSALGSGKIHKNSDQSLEASVKNRFNDYIKAKRELSQIDDITLYTAKYALFQKKEVKKLKKILEDTSQIDESFNELSKGVDEYVLSIKSFLQDYQRASDEGFSAIREQVGPYRVIQLRNRATTLTSLKTELRDVINNVRDANTGYTALAKQELRKLTKFQKISPRDVDTLVDTSKQIKYPNIRQLPLATEIMGTLDVVPD